MTGVTGGWFSSGVSVLTFQFLGSNPSQEFCYPGVGVFCHFFGLKNVVKSF